MKELNVTTALEQDTRPIVAWNSPNIAPTSEKMFLVAIQHTYYRQSTNEHIVSTLVFNAQYVNRPLEVDSNGEPTNDHHFVNDDGEPIEAIGWYSVKEHSEFDNYYEPLQFYEDYVLLGWAEYQVPEFTGVSNGQ